MTTLYEDTNAYEELQIFLKEAANRQRAHAFALAVASDEEDDDAGTRIHIRHGQPCWGEIRTHYNDIPKPSDLHHPFPEGIPIGLAVYLREAWLETLKIFMQEDSPWRTIFNTENINVHENGFILKNTKIDPTFLLNGLLNIKYFFYNSNKDIPWYIQLYINQHVNKNTWMTYTFSSYHLESKICWYNYLNSCPENITIDASTLYERGAYNRRDLAYLFRSSDNSKNTGISELKKICPNPTPEAIRDILVPYIHEKGAKA